MSYFRRDADRSRYAADRLPIYVFPAFVGSGRILLGMVLAGVTTAVLMHTRAAGDPTLWWLGLVSYLASVVLVISGIYAVNAVPPHQRILPPPEPAGGPTQVSRPAPVGPAARPRVASTPEQLQSHLAVLLVDRWRVITKEQLSRALVRQASSGRSLVYELARMGLLTDENLEHILTLQAADQDPWHESPRHD